MKFLHFSPFQYAALATFFIAAFILAYTAAAAPTGQAKRLGLRGMKRRRALEEVPLWRETEPVVRWLGARFSGLMSEKWKRDVNRQISLAGDYMGLMPEETLGFAIVSACGGLLAGIAFGWVTGMGAILVLAGAGFGAILPFMRISSTATERLKTVSRRLPYAIDLLALAMGAGLDFPGAVRQVVEKSGSADNPVVEEFTLILQSLQLGRTRRQALEAFAARAPTPAVLEFVGAVVQAELRGNPVVDVLRIQAEVSRRKRSVAAEEAASKAGVKMVIPLVLVFACILILIVSPMGLSLQDTL
jgi:tight adherence protein C